MNKWEEDMIEQLRKKSEDIRFQTVCGRIR